MNFNKDSLTVSFGFLTNPYFWIISFSVLFLILTYVFRKWISDNHSTIIKGLILYPFIMVLDLLLEPSIFIVINKNKGLSIINELIPIFGYISALSIMLIILTLIISHAVDRTSQFIKKSWYKPIIFISSLLLPFFFMPSITKKLLTTQDITKLTLVFMICSLILSYLFADTFSKFKNSSLKIGNKFTVSKEWIGFLGTIISAIISLIATILTKK